MEERWKEAEKMEKNLTGAECVPLNTHALGRLFRFLKNRVT